jgi:hypothetical protein
MSSPGASEHQDRGWGRTLLKAFALFAGYMVVLATTVAGVFLYAVLQL